LVSFEIYTTFTHVERERELMLPRFFD